MERANSEAARCRSEMSALEKLIVECDANQKTALRSQNVLLKEHSFLNSILSNEVNCILIVGILTVHVE